MSGAILGQGPDALSPKSRSFYENVKYKAVLSIVYAATALAFLGFTSSSGGESASAQQYHDAGVSFISTPGGNYVVGSVDDDQNKVFNDDQNINRSTQALISGYGFATFCYFVGFVLALAAAIQISPFGCGSARENKIIRDPAGYEQSSTA